MDHGSLCRNCTADPPAGLRRLQTDEPSRGASFVCDSGSGAGCRGCNNSKRHFTQVGPDRETLKVPRTMNLPWTRLGSSVASSPSHFLARATLTSPIQLTSRAMSTTSMSNSVLAKLEQYTACDISDALLKLKVPGAGFIADLNSYSGKPGNDAGTLTIAPVSTVLFAAKGETLAEPTPNVPKDTHWTDVTEPGTFVVMKQPPGQTNAICGGIMALRMKIREAKGILVAGRVRDVEELRSTNLPVCSVLHTHTPPLLTSEATW